MAKRATPEAEKTAKVEKAETSDEVRTRRSFGSRGWLAAEIDRVLRSNPDKKWKVGEVVAEITNSQGEHPSSGAVAACFQRWSEAGYIKTSKTRPLSFESFPAKWKGSDLDTFLESERGKRAKERAAAKAN
jgi:hypothetical protein